jgi:hypothetical protein
MGEKICENRKKDGRQKFDSKRPEMKRITVNDYFGAEEFALARYYFPGKDPSAKNILCPSPKQRSRLSLPRVARGPVRLC